MAVPSFGFTEIDVALTASTSPRTSRCTLGRVDSDFLHSARFASTAVFAPVPVPS